jgi:hypothetical protein
LSRKENSDILASSSCSSVLASLSCLDKLDIDRFFGPRPSVKMQFSVKIVVLLKDNTHGDREIHGNGHGAWSIITLK